MRIVIYDEIDRNEWRRLVLESETGTWFQTPEAYDFFASQPELFKPFVCAIVSDPAGVQTEKAQLKGICCGYITKEKSSIRQLFTRRAIIIGGPCFADDCTNKEVETLMLAVREYMKQKAIYIETRNLNSYEQWEGAFERAGFEYKKHLNFHVHTDRPWEEIEEKIGKHRRKYIRLSLRNGITIETQPTTEQVKAYYVLLQDLYRTKVKTPLYPWSFFERLHQSDFCQYLLVMYNGKVVGGNVVVMDEHTIYEWFACGKDAEIGNVHPASVVKYVGMKYAQEHGCERYDMMGAGEPAVPYGVRDFKSEFGGELVEHGRWLCVCKPWLYKLGTYVVKLLRR